MLPLTTALLGVVEHHPVLPDSVSVEHGTWLAFALNLMASGILVFLTVAGVRRYVARWLSGWRGGRIAHALLSDEGGVWLCFAAGALSAVAAALAANQPISFTAVMGILSSLVASGIRSWQRKLSAAYASSNRSADQPKVEPQ